MNFKIKDRMMLRRITLALLLTLVSPLAFAGIIGAGGSPTVADAAMTELVNRAEEVTVNSDVYRRVDMRLSTQDRVKLEVENNQNIKEKADFIKVLVGNESKIVESGFRMKLVPAN